MRKMFSFLNDLAFKATFGAEANKRLLIALLNALLEREGEDRIESVVLLDPFNLQKADNDKLSVVDVKACDARGRRYAIEVQLRSRPDFCRRSVYYLCRLFADQLGAGEKYDDLCRATAIALIDFVQFKQHNEIQSIFRLHDPLHHEVLSEALELRFVELRKAAVWPVRRAHTRFEKWLHILRFGTRYPDPDRLPTELAEEQEIAMSLKELQRINADSILRERMAAREKFELDHSSLVEAARIEARAEGRTEGEMQKAVEIAKKLLKLGSNPDDVVSITGLARAEVEKLRGE